MKLGGRYVGYSFADQNLAGAELCGEFVDVDFSRANLVGARLNGKFIDASFIDADLTGADVRDGVFIDSETELMDLDQTYETVGLIQKILSLFR